MHQEHIRTPAFCQSTSSSLQQVRIWHAPFCVQLHILLPVVVVHSNLGSARYQLLPSCFPKEIILHIKCSTRGSRENVETWIYHCILMCVKYIIIQRAAQCADAFTKEIVLHIECFTEKAKNIDVLYTKCSTGATHGIMCPLPWDMRWLDRNTCACYKLCHVLKTQYCHGVLVKLPRCVQAVKPWRL